MDENTSMEKYNFCIKKEKIYNKGMIDWITKRSKIQAGTNTQK